jgi:hypothetical protein
MAGAIASISRSFAIQPIQGGGSIVKKRVPVTHAEMLILLESGLIDGANIEVLAHQPTVQISHDANASCTAMLAVPFAK